MKKTFNTETAYILGLITLALGTVLMERADFGMSMVVAPAYLIYLKLSQQLPWFSFGMAEYGFQALLIVVLAMLMGGMKRKYLFSFITAFLYGTILDVVMKAIPPVSADGTVLRFGLYAAGLAACAMGVAFLFHTYISPEAYELFVKEISGRFGFDIHRTKTVYDCCSCVLAVLLSFLFLGFPCFEGVKAGTVFCAAINGWVIGQCSRLLERHFVFQDALALRKFFQ